jgi:hypothetical protein
MVGSQDLTLRLGARSFCLGPGPGPATRLGFCVVLAQQQKHGRDEALVRLGAPQRVQVLRRSQPLGGRSERGREIG